MPVIDPFVTAIFMIAAFSAAGLMHSLWLASPMSRVLDVPVDGGIRIRGRRLFGDNKTIRGFVVMPPAAGMCFLALGALLGESLPSLRGQLWPISNIELGVLGALAGLGFMLGELPNSFAKRQLDIAPGEPPRGRVATVVSFAADRLDSIVGMLAVVALVTPTPMMTWVYVLLLGPGVHLGFSILLHRLGVKARAA